MVSEDRTTPANAMGKEQGDTPRVRRDAHDDYCLCGHRERAHDALGCNACDRKGKMCPEYQKSVPWERDKRDRSETLARRVRDAGFMNHVGPLATCTNCWEPIRVGIAGTMSTLIQARAHAQKCRHLAKDTG